MINNIHVTSSDNPFRQIIGILMALTVLFFLPIYFYIRLNTTVLMNKKERRKIKDFYLLHNWKIYFVGITEVNTGIRKKDIMTGIYPGTCLDI